MVKMGMRKEPGLGGHEVPGLSTQIEADLEFGDPPVTLHRRPRVTLDGQAAMVVRQKGSVIDHEKLRSLTLPARQNLFCFLKIAGADDHQPVRSDMGRERL